MSKTYHRNKKLEFKRNLEPWGSEDDCPGFSGLTRRRNWEEAIDKCVKIRKKKKTLWKEFTKFGISPLRKSWKNPVGDAHEQSSRLHVMKREMAHKRRHKMKVEAQNIIDDSLNENV